MSEKKPPTENNESKITTGLLKSEIKVAPEVAREEFFKWLRDVRRVKERLVDEKNPDCKESLENCIANIVDGTFKIDWDTGKITHKLTFPIGEDYDHPIDELTYNTRINIAAFDKTRKFKNADENTQMKIMISTLSNKGFGLVTKMDSSDMSTCSDLMYFYFLG